MGPRDRPVTLQRTLPLSFSLRLALLAHRSRSRTPSPSRARSASPSNDSVLLPRVREFYSTLPLLRPRPSYDPYSNDAVARTYRGSNCVVGFSEKEIRVSRRFLVRRTPAADIIIEPQRSERPETPIYIRDCQRMSRIGSTLRNDESKGKREE